MKTRRSCSLAVGFTLVEILLVITIVAVLTGLTLSSIGGAMRTTRNTTTKATVTALRSAVAEYEMHYNRLPASSARADVTLDTAVGSLLMAVLLGQNEQRLDPARVRFMEADKMAQNGRDGFVSQGSALGLLDYWGEPFQVVLDGDGDQWLVNPDAGSSDERISSAAAARLPSRVLVFSKGADRMAHTQDDVVSWR